MEPWPMLALAVLATWRVSHLLAHEDGPWDAVLRLRVRMGDGQWGRLLDCFHCVSLWVAAPLALTVARSPPEWLLAWLGLSGAACLLERLGGSAPATIQPLDIQGEDDGLLRTTAPGAGNERLEQNVAEPTRRSGGEPAGATDADDSAPLHIVR